MAEVALLCSQIANGTNCESPHTARSRPEDLRKHGDKAVRLAGDLAPGEIVGWAGAPLKQGDTDVNITWPAIRIWRWAGWAAEATLPVRCKAILAPAASCLVGPDRDRRPFNHHRFNQYRCHGERQADRGQQDHDRRRFAAALPVRCQAPLAPAASCLVGPDRNSRPFNHHRCHGERQADRGQQYNDRRRFACHRHGHGRQVSAEMPGSGH